MDLHAIIVSQTIFIVLFTKGINTPAWVLARGHIVYLFFLLVASHSNLNSLLDLGSLDIILVFQLIKIIPSGIWLT